MASAQIPVFLSQTPSIENGQVGVVALRIAWLSIPPAPNLRPTLRWGGGGGSRLTLRLRFDARRGDQGLDRKIRAKSKIAGEASLKCLDPGSGRTIPAMWRIPVCLSQEPSTQNAIVRSAAYS